MSSLEPTACTGLWRKAILENHASGFEQIKFNNFLCFRNPYIFVEPGYRQTYELESTEGGCFIMLVTTTKQHMLIAILEFHSLT
jgi:hypothetical protein